MDKPIIASFRLSKEEFMRSQRMALRHSVFGRRVTRIPIGIGVVILLNGLVQFYASNIGFFVFLWILLFASFFFVIPLMTRRAAAKMYSQKPDRDMLVTWEVFSDRVISSTELARSENTWAFFVKAIRVPEGFLLYPNERLFHWIPAHAFRDAGDIERFAELTKSKVKQYTCTS